MVGECLAPRIDGTVFRFMHVLLDPDGNGLIALLLLLSQHASSALIWTLSPVQHGGGGVQPVLMRHPPSYLSKLGGGGGQF